MTTVSALTIARNNIAKQISSLEKADGKLLPHNLDVFLTYYCLETILNSTGAAASAIGTFEATGNGAGYAVGDPLILLSDGTWRNANGGTAIATPTVGTYGPFGSQGDPEITRWRATTTNAGNGYTTGDILTEIINTETGGASWYNNGTAIGTPPATDRELPSGAASNPYEIVTATTAGTGYTAGNDVLITFDTSGAPTGGYNLSANTVLTAPPNPSHFNYGAAPSTSSGGGVAVIYSVNGGATGLNGAWDIANSQIYPSDGSAAIQIGAAATQATITSFASEDDTSLVSYDVVGGATGLTGFEKGGVLYATATDLAAGNNPLTIGTANGEAQLSTTSQSTPATSNVYLETYRLTSRIGTAAAAKTERLATTGGPAASVGDPGNTLILANPETIKSISVTELSGAQFGGLFYTGNTPNGLLYVLGGGNDFVSKLPQYKGDSAYSLIQSPIYEVSLGVEGSGAVGSTIEVFRSGGSEGTTTVGADGRWAFRQRGFFVANDTDITVTEAGLATNNFEVKHCEIEIEVVRSA